MQIEPVWLLAVMAGLGALGAGLFGLRALARWWRQRLAGDELRSIRARIAEAAPETGPVSQVPAPAMREVVPRDRSSLARRTRLASSFVGRDPEAEPV